MEYYALGVNTTPADALAPKVARASAGMVLALKDRQYILLLQSQFHLLGSSQIQDINENGNISIVIFKAIQRVKC